jgi:hypothetical protein
LSLHYHPPSISYTVRFALYKRKERKQRKGVTITLRELVFMI